MLLQLRSVGQDTWQEIGVVFAWLKHDLGVFSGKVLDVLS